MSIASAESASTGWTPYQLPPLGYGYAALVNYPQLCKFEIEQLLRRLSEVPPEVREAVRNQGGGHANHSLLWKLLSPCGGGAPVGDLLRGICSAFGSLDQFQKQSASRGAR
jgi:superoxide dismutase, Fe-Mn family